MDHEILRKIIQGRMQSLLRKYWLVFCRNCILQRRLQCNRNNFFKLQGNIGNKFICFFKTYKTYICMHTFEVGSTILHNFFLNRKARAFCLILNEPKNWFLSFMYIPRDILLGGQPALFTVILVTAMHYLRLTYIA